MYVGQNNCEEMVGNAIYEIGLTADMHYDMKPNYVQLETGEVEVGKQRKRSRKTGAEKMMNWRCQL
jgi:hypothetical protein